MNTKPFMTAAAAAAALLGMAAPAFADKVEAPFRADTAEKFAATERDVRTEMSSGGRYEFISPENRAKVEADMGKMEALFRQTGSVAAMNVQQQTQLFNIQEHLNGVLTHSDSNRLVCDHTAPVGTHIPLTTCKTVAEIEKARRDSQLYMRDHAKDADVNSAAMHAIHEGRGN